MILARQSRGRPPGGLHGGPLAPQCSSRRAAGSGLHFYPGSLRPGVRWNRPGKRLLMTRKIVCGGFPPSRPMLRFTVYDVLLLTIVPFKSTRLTKITGLLYRCAHMLLEYLHCTKGPLEYFFPFMFLFATFRCNCEDHLGNMSWCVSVAFWWYVRVYVCLYIAQRCTGGVCIML